MHKCKKYDILAPMKIWIKYLAGIILGIVAAFLLPQNSPQAQAILDFLTELVIRVGRYALLPMLFFSIIMACYKLREEKKILKTGAWTCSLIVLSSLFLTLLGLLSALIIKLPRIPMITIERSSEVPALNIKELVMKMFPYTGFEALLEGAYLLPCFVFAGLAGAGASSEKSYAKPAVTLFDSLSRICYNVMGFFTEILAVGMIAITCRWMLNFFILKRTNVYLPLIFLLTFDFAFVALVVYPLFLKLICRESHPFRVLYASFCPLLVAFFSGDTNLTLPLNIRHGKESLGIKRRTNAVTFPLFSIFARGGAALVQAVCFIVIFRSYSPLKIELSNILWIGVMSFLLSFLLCDHPSGGPFFMLTLMCMMFGPSFEVGHLLLKDAAPVICSFAAAFDALTAVFGSYIVATKTQTIEPQELRHFI